MTKGYQLCGSGGRRHEGGMETHLRESQGCWDRGCSGDQEMCEGAAGGHRARGRAFRGGLEGEGAAVAQSPQRDASTFRVAAGVEWGAMERARAQWRGHLGTLELL
ncbi:unnamed protein product [Pleuronectes platessa]|uniref:Uncharacterized protein n=1 Tax=Pleuronectes platessa TaxID=8262 RepID=A0A9N7VFF8_PLEPL|nr:unnamed protein product [Pleuronectes platessa]